jgi:acyl-CoA synthetase (AMP-forming)/AMP-acid ligase II
MNGLALSTDGRPLSPGLLDDLLQEAKRIASVLGLGPGSGLQVAADDPLGTVLAAALASDLGPAIVLTRRPRQALAAAPDERWAFLVTHDDGSALDLRPAIRRGTPPLPPAAGALMHTSGTTSVPRPVVLSREGLEHNARATAERFAIGNADALLLPLPIHHAYGFSVVEVARRTGAQLHLETSPSARRVVRRLRSDRVTVLDGVPSFYRQLLAIVRAEPSTASLLRGLRAVGCGGDLLPRGIAVEFAAGVEAPLLDGYGLTEAGPNVTLSAPGQHRLGTVGLPLQGVELRLADDSELLVRSPSMMMGYLDDPAASAAAIDGEGWLRTGDLAEIDADGYVVVLGRKKQVIVVHGECSSPAIIEDAALAVGGVEQAIAVGVPARRPSGDWITLFVQPVAGLSAGVIRTRVAAGCRAQLPVHLRPDSIVVLDSLPRGATGKPDRDTLRRRAAIL